ncbi:MAG: inositol monophosphatase family protein [Pseudomonadota bacterium]
MHAHLNIAIRAARRAGEIIMRALPRLHELTIHEKQPNDFVSEVDRLAEQEIIDTIRASYPDHSFLGEESGRIGEERGEENVWIIDPLDGTTNFLHGFPVFAVSIALQQRGALQHGVVYDPSRQELFTASRGEGAQLDGRRIRVGRRTNLNGALVGTGFPYAQNLEYMDTYLAMFRAISEKTAGLRRPGAAALDLAYLAAGRYDGFFEMGLHPWDMAAGALLVREAGGLVGTFAGDERYLETGNIVAGSPKVFAEMLKTFAPHLPPTLRRPAG